jgi:PAS domain S-box-containing protein
MNAWPSGFKRDIELEHTLFERQIKSFIQDFFDQASVETQAFQILNSLEEGLIIFDLQGKPVLFNPSALRILNVSEEQLLAYNLLNEDETIKYFESGEICPPSEYAGRKALLEGKSCFKQVLGRALTDEQRIWISQDAVPLYKLGESVWHGVILTFRDISENVEQLQQLRIREKSLIEAQRIARLGFWEWDLSSNRLNWSPEIYRIFGRSPETFEATYPNFLLTLPESDRAILENAVQQAFDDHLPYSLEHRLVMPSGEIRYVHEQAEVMRDPFGKPLKMLGVVRDITESTLSQLSLSTQQARLELALESSGLGILEWDLYTDRVYIDARMEEILACSQASIINFADFEALFQSEQKSTLFFHMSNLLESQNPFELELWLEQPEREKKCVRIRGKSLLNEQSQSYRIIAVFLDITQHKLAEQKLEEQIHLRTINLEATLKEKDRRMQELRCLYAIAQRLHDRAHSADLVRDVIDLLEMGFSDPGNWCFELEMSKDYAICDCAHESVPLREITIQLGPAFDNGFLRLYRGLNPQQPGVELSTQEEDLLQGVAFMLEQTWQRHLIQEQLQLAREEAEAANLSKSLFLANMSHEIRTPLTAIQGFSELLRMELQEPHLLKYLDIIQNNKQTLMVLLQDILDLSKVEAGKLLFQPVPLQISGLVQDLWLMFQKPFQEKGIEFEMQLPEIEIKPIYQDEHRLRQIINNLLNNALKFTETGKVVLSVNIHSQSENRISLEIAVQDTGIGVPLDFRDFLFRPFEQYQGHTHLSGAGLGLSIASRLAHLMRGELKYQPHPSGGSRFSLCLPEQEYAKIHTLVKPVQRVFPEDKVNFEPALVLIADDILENRLYLEQALNKMGLEHCSASNGKEALALALTQKPNLILLDLRMPEMNGQEVLQALRTHSDTSHIPVLALTASGLQDEDFQLKLAGFENYLRKPFSIGELQLLLMQYLPNQLEKTHNQSLFALSEEKKLEIFNLIKYKWIDECEKIKSSVILNEINEFIQSLSSFSTYYNLSELNDFILRLNQKMADYDLIDLSEMIQDLSLLLQNMLHSKEN